MNIIKQMFETPDTPSGKKRLNNLITRLGLGKKIKGDLMKDVVSGELGGGASSGEITLNDIFNVHPYKLIVKEYPYPCTKGMGRYDGFRPTRLDGVMGVHFVSTDYLNKDEFYFKKDGVGDVGGDYLSSVKIPIDTVDILEGTVEMYYCIVRNLSFILLYGPKEYTDMLIDEMKQGGI